MLGKSLVALLLLGLSIYIQSKLQIGLACIWLLTGVRNYNASILEVTEEEIILKNSWGFITKKHKYKEADIEIKGNRIFLNKKKIYTHSFMFLRQDFKKVCAFLLEQNPANNLQRHLIGEEV